MALRMAGSSASLRSLRNSIILGMPSSRADSISPSDTRAFFALAAFEFQRYVIDARDRAFKEAFIDVADLFHVERAIG